MTTAQREELAHLSAAEILICTIRQAAGQQRRGNNLVRTYQSPHPGVREHQDLSQQLRNAEELDEGQIFEL